jgi:hypothetical protein
MKSTLLLVWAIMIGCGGRVELDGPPGSGMGGAGASASTTTSNDTGSSGGFAPHPECAASDGTRICGGEACPWLEPPECVGYGCASALSRDSLEASNGGVCWADLPSAGAELCYGCPEGDACIHRTAEQLICGSIGVCEALWDLGVTDVCRYADKTPYDHQPIPNPPSAECPGGDVGALCGGGCSPCNPSQRCVGRSPTHPFGLCASKGSDDDPANYVRRCSPDETGEDSPCINIQWSPEVACAVFEGTGAPKLARRYGLCLSKDDCLHAAAHLPGGVVCYNDKGKKLAP